MQASAVGILSIKCRPIAQSFVESITHYTHGAVFVDQNPTGFSRIKK